MIALIIIHIMLKVFKQINNVNNNYREHNLYTYHQSNY